MGTGFKDLLKGASILGSARIVEFVVGLLKIKVSAVILGTTGIGVFNQLNFLSNKMSEFTLLSTSEALVKQIAENSNDAQSSDLVLSALKSYIVLVCVFMVLALGILYLLSENITLYVFGDKAYSNAFLVALASLPLLVSTSIPFSILRALKDMKSIAKARVWIALLNIFHAFPLIYFWELEGAILSVFLSHLVGLVVNLLYAKKLYFRRLNVSFRTLMTAKMETGYFKELFEFSGFGLSIGIYVIISEFVCRSIVVSQIGVEAIGLYSPIIMWAGLFTSVLVTSLSTQLYTSFCQATNNKEIITLLNDGLRLATFGLLPLVFMAIPYRELIITVFYSEEFIEAEKYLPFHFLGVVFQVWYSVFASSMSSTGRIKQHGFFRFFYLSTDIAVTYYFVMSFGLYGWMLKHIISPVIFFFVYALYCKKSMSFRVLGSNLIMMCYLLISSVGLILIDELWDSGRYINFVFGPVLIFVSYIFLRDNERVRIKEFCSNNLRRFKLL